MGNKLSNHDVVHYGDHGKESVRNSLEAHHAIAAARHEMHKAHGRSFDDYYECTQLVGQGSFARVSTCIQRSSGKSYAVKVISKTLEDGREQRDAITKEVAVLLLLRGHPNMVEFVEFFETCTAFSIVMQHCAGGELFDQIISKGHYSERQAAQYMKQVLSFLDHMQRRHVIHRDLKPENIMLLDRSPDSPLKFIDFGTAEFCEPGDTLKGRYGSPHYVAPEVLASSYSFPADVWSAGVILYILLTGRPVFSARTETMVLEKVAAACVLYHDEDWSSVSVEARDMTARMLVRDPALRATVAQLRAHAWFQVVELSSEAWLCGSVVRRLRCFAGMSRMKRLALLTLARTLSDREVKKLRAEFLRMDSDGDGRISAEDLHEVLQSMGTALCTDELVQLITAADIEGNSQIPYEEFIAAMIDNQLVANRHRAVRESFDLLDRDRDGFITADDLVPCLGAVCSEQSARLADARDILGEVDKAHRGRVSFDEFARMMMSDGSLMFVDSEQQPRQSLKAHGAGDDAAAAQGESDPCAEHASSS